jgi:hypothetical protein
MNGRVALSKHTESPDKVEAGQRRLREVHPGVPLLNRQCAAIANSFADFTTYYRIAITTILHNCKK